MKSKTRKFLLIALLIGASANGQEPSTVVKQIVEAYDGVQSLEIWQHEHNGEVVFYVPLARILCCDMMSELYNAKGEMICKPDGGIAGSGDGKCLDFVSLRSTGVRVWPLRESGQPAEEDGEGQRE